MHLSFYAIGFYALLSRKRNSRPGLALPVAEELIIFLARVYRAYHMPGLVQGVHMTKSRDFWGRDLIKRVVNFRLMS